MLVEELKERWWKRITESGLRGCKVVVSVRGLKPEEAIGRPLHGDYPILRGREVLIQAELEGAIGQAFTDEPRRFEVAWRTSTRWASRAMAREQCS